MIDIEYDTDRDLVIDATGDFGTVTGRDNVEQQHRNAVFRAAENIRTELANNNVEAEIEREVEAELKNIGYVTRVTVNAKAKPPREVVVQVETNATLMKVTV